MSRRLPSREWVFVLSLLLHGFNLTHKRKNLKEKRGYVIISTNKEDARGIDLWVKMPRKNPLIPLQITMREVRLHRKFSRCSEHQFRDFVERSEQRLATKRAHCKVSGIAFVLVRDSDEKRTSRSLAWGDLKALHYALERVKLRDWYD